MKDVFKPEQAAFAAGCFWGVQYYFDQVPGVTETVAGYTGGHAKDPTYEEVCAGQTGHAEAVLVSYHPDKVSFKQLLRHFFRLHDPTQVNRQGPDIGPQYRSAVFCSTPEQRQLARQAKSELNESSKRPIATQIRPLMEFWTAEDYHQKFTQRTGRGMCHVAYEPL